MIYRLLFRATCFLLVLVSLVSIFSLLTNAAVFRQDQGDIYFDVEKLPFNRVAVVLGTTARSRGGGVNPFFAARIDAAAALYNAKRVEHILVSGDNRHKSHNEPVDMLNALVAAGVPKENITLDYAGFRTLDTIYRAKKIFQLKSATLVTQRYHAHRALYLADSAGLAAFAFAAEEPKGSSMTMAEMREYLARVKAVIDVHVLRKQPHFLGDPEPIQPMAPITAEEPEPIEAPIN